MKRLYSLVKDVEDEFILSAGNFMKEFCLAGENNCVYLENFEQKLLNWLDHSSTIKEMAELVNQGFLPTNTKSKFLKNNTHTVILFSESGFLFSKFFIARI